MFVVCSNESGDRMRWPFTTTRHNRSDEEEADADAEFQAARAHLSIVTGELNEVLDRIEKQLRKQQRPEATG